MTDNRKKKIGDYKFQDNWPGSQHDKGEFFLIKKKIFILHHFPLKQFTDIGDLKIMCLLGY